MTEILQTYRDAAKWANNLPREDFNKVLLLINKREETIEQETVAKIVADLLKDGSFECAGYVQGKWGKP